MRAALLLAATAVTANARPIWRADRAMMPALAASPADAKDTARARTPQTYTPTLANPTPDVPPERVQESVERARTLQRHAPAPSQSTLQQCAAETRLEPRPPALPAKKHTSCCAQAHLRNKSQGSTRATRTRTRKRANLPAHGRGLRGLETRDFGKQPTPESPPPPRAASALPDSMASKQTARKIHHEPTVPIRPISQILSNPPPLLPLPAQLPHHGPLRRADRHRARHRAPQEKHVRGIH